MDSYRRYGPALLRKARRLLRNEDDARDAVQSLFVELLQNPALPHDLAFLYRALTHRCLNALRDERNHARLLARQSDALAGCPRLSADDRSLGLDTLLKLSRTVEEAVMETLVYRFIDELGQEEIARVMSVSRKTVQNRLERALDGLRALTEVQS